MTSAKSIRNLMLAGACALAWSVGFGAHAVAGAQEAPTLTPAQVVKTQTYVSLEPVPRGKNFEVAVVVDINAAYHMNSHKPSQTYLIPTTLTPQLPDGITLVDTIYPPGHTKKFSFSDNPLNVYAGKITLRMKLAAGEKVALGDTEIPITLRYQACNSSACLPPVKIPLKASLKVVEAGKAAHTVHPEIFSAGR
ncbi:MAG TPA: protein-disulfide reductase DsbD domain-containing protein [Candidatus Aquilonibacter sp.]|nr:protein-disulfide reductase DsbD domain-containing protein [Candidatus Aquilonibacter sp.]